MENTEDKSPLEILAGAQKASLVSFSALLLVQIALYFDAYRGMVDIWYRSETFAHGFLIFPISLYLIWTRRDRLSRLAIKPDIRAVVFLAGAGFVWMLAELVDVLALQQFAVVAMIPLLVWLVFGFELVRALYVSFGLYAVRGAGG